jgi:hypothetical protein
LLGEQMERPGLPSNARSRKQRLVPFRSAGLSVASRYLMEQEHAR